MEARVASVLKGIARSMAPSGLTKALSFRVVEFASRDDDAVRSYPPARGQQWPLQQCLVQELLEKLVEVLSKTGSSSQLPSGLSKCPRSRARSLPRHSRVS